MYVYMCVNIHIHVYIYIYIYTHIYRERDISLSLYIYTYTGPQLLQLLQACASTADTGVCEKNYFSGEEDPWESQLQKHQIRGWRAVYVMVLQGKGSRKRSVFSQTPISPLGSV